MFLPLFLLFHDVGNVLYDMSLLALCIDTCRSAY